MSDVSRANPMWINVPPGKVHDRMRGRGRGALIKKDASNNRPSSALLESLRRSRGIAEHNDGPDDADWTPSKPPLAFNKSTLSPDAPVDPSLLDLLQRLVDSFPPILALVTGYAGFVSADAHFVAVCGLTNTPVPRGQPKWARNEYGGPPGPLVLCTVLSNRPDWVVLLVPAVISAEQVIQHPNGGPSAHIPSHPTRLLAPPPYSHALFWRPGIREEEQLLVLPQCSPVILGTWTRTQDADAKAYIAGYAGQPVDPVRQAEQTSALQAVGRQYPEHVGNHHFAQCGSAHHADIDHLPRSDEAFKEWKQRDGKAFVCGFNDRWVEAQLVLNEKNPFALTVPRVAGVCAASSRVLPRPPPDQPYDDVFLAQQLAKICQEESRMRAAAKLAEAEVQRAHAERNRLEQEKRRENEAKRFREQHEKDQRNTRNVDRAAKCLRPLFALLVLELASCIGITAAAISSLPSDSETFGWLLGHIVPICPIVLYPVWRFIMLPPGWGRGYYNIRDATTPLRALRHYIMLPIAFVRLLLGFPTVPGVLWSLTYHFPGDTQGSSSLLLIAHIWILGAQFLSLLVVLPDFLAKLRSQRAFYSRRELVCGLALIGELLAVGIASWSAGSTLDHRADPLCSSPALNWLLIHAGLCFATALVIVWAASDLTEQLNVPERPWQWAMLALVRLFLPSVSAFATVYWWSEGLNHRTCLPADLYGVQLWVWLELVVPLCALIPVMCARGCYINCCGGRQQR